MPSTHRDTTSPFPLTPAGKTAQSMAMASFFFAWGLLALLLSTLHAQTRTQEFFQPSGSTLTFKTLSERVPHGGCASVVVEIRNLSNRDAFFDLNFVSSSETNGVSSGRISQSTVQRIAAAAGSTHSERFLIPLAPAMRPTRYTWDMVEPTLRISYSGSATGAVVIGESYPWNEPNMLLSRSLYSPQSEVIDNEWKSKISSSGSRSARAAGEFDPMSLIADWRTLIGFDVMIMRDSEWTALQRPVQQCIEDWIKHGGHLRIVTPKASDRSTADWLPSLDPTVASGTCVPIQLRTDGTVDVHELFKSCQKSDQMHPRLSSLQNDFGVDWPLVPFFGQKPMRFVGMILVLTVFALLVGPVNVFYLARVGQRHLLFRTTPLLAALACVVLMLMIMLEDGTGGKGARLQWVQMEPGATASYQTIHQEQFCRTGVLLNRSFTLSDDTLLLPVPIAESRWARLTTRNETNLDLMCRSEKDHWRLGQDYFFSRSEHAHVLLQRAPSRARIERLGSEKPVTLRSTFDYELGPVFYRDSNNQLHRCARLSPGETQTLQPCQASELNDQVKSTLGLFSRHCQRDLTETMSHRDQVIALSQTAPGIATLPSIQWLSTQTIITGPVHATAASPSQP